jgi:AcrR family transcriptional regulator
VSEGSIFKRFPTKHALFLASIGVSPDSDWTRGLDEMVGQGEVQENLAEVLRRIMVFFRELLPRTMLLWSCTDAKSSKFPGFHGPRSPARRGIEVLARFLSAEMELGRLRRSDPEVTARVLVSAAWNQAFLETMGAEQPENGPEYGRRVVKTLWEGLAPVAQAGDGGAEPASAAAGSAPARDPSVGSDRSA